MVPRQGTAKILIAEDSDILNNMLRDIFEEHGYEVFQAFDGLDCKSMFLKSKPDLALVDVQMPKLDGLEVLRYIKERDPRTLVIVMTGIGTEETAVKAMKLGAEDYLSKPFVLKDVVALAEKLLENRRGIEENARLKRKIRQSEKYLAQLTTAINEALITTDPAGKIQFSNRAAHDMWGYSKEELKDEDVHFLISGESDSPLHRDVIRDTIRLTKIEGEFHFRKKDKGIFPGYLSTSVIMEENKVRGIVLLVTDLTNLLEIKRKLKQSEKLASLGRVVEGVAHEVRNCLTSLGGFTKRLSKAAANDPLCSQYTGIIMEDVLRLEKMVRDIEEYVHFSRFYNYSFVKLDLPALIKQAAARVAEKIGNNAAHIEMNLHIDPDLPAVDGDPKAIEEIFYNLILNAYEAMPDGGQLMVTSKNMISGVMISFADTGVGIDDADIGEIFNPFFTSKTTGAGMGLTKVYLLVEEHDGLVNVISKPKKGTTFEVYFPLHVDSAWRFPDKESKNGLLK